MDVLNGSISFEQRVELDLEPSNEALSQVSERRIELIKEDK